MQTGIKQVQEALQLGIKDLKDRMDEQVKNVDKLVQEKPLVTLGVVFVAGLALGVLATLAARGKD